jgi:hypothetical protein
MKVAQDIHKYMILFLIAASDMNDRRKDLVPKIAKQLNIPVQELFYIWMSPLHSETKRSNLIKNTNWKYWFHGFVCDLWNTKDERFLPVSFGPKGRIDTFVMDDISRYVFTSKSPWPEYNELKAFLFEGEAYEFSNRLLRKAFFQSDFNERSFYIPYPDGAKIDLLMEELRDYEFIERSCPEIYSLVKEKNRGVFIPKLRFMKQWKTLSQKQRSEPGMRKIYEEYKNSKIFSRLKAKYKFKRLWMTMTKSERIDTILCDRWIISTKGKDQIKAQRA